jgi:hypothetical protein
VCVYDSSLIVAFMIVATLFVCVCSEGPKELPCLCITASGAVVLEQTLLNDASRGWNPSRSVYNIVPSFTHSSLT